MTNTAHCTTDYDSTKKFIISWLILLSPFKRTCYIRQLILWLYYIEMQSAVTVRDDC